MVDRQGKSFMEINATMQLWNVVTSTISTWLLLNFYRLESNDGVALRGVIYDEQGIWMKGYGGSCEKFSKNEDEELDLFWGLENVCNLGIKNLVLNGY